jgi:RimJ/RimL family protein N-acetyltransferase
MTIPTLETARLVLRAPTLGDFDESLAMWSHPLVVRYFGRPPFTGEEVWARLLRYAGHWALLGYGYWVVADRDTGRYVGEVGFADLRRDLEPALAGTPEIGWCVSPRAQGQGHATEAVVAALAWGDHHFGPVATACIIAPDNTPSLRMASKTGYRETSRTTYKGLPTIILKREPGF